MDACSFQTQRNEILQDKAELRNRRNPNRWRLQKRHMRWRRQQEASTERLSVALMNEPGINVPEDSDYCFFIWQSHPHPESGRCVKIQCCSVERGFVPFLPGAKMVHLVCGSMVGTLGRRTPP